MRFGYVWQVSSWQKVLNKLRYFCLSLWRRLGENYPENYFSLILQGPTLYVVRFVGNHAVQETCFDISQNDFHNVNEILNKFPDYPLQILLHGEDSQFRLVSLKTVRWWDCAPLLKQAKENEFSNTDWHQTQPAGCRQDRYRYLLMGLHPSLYLQKLIKNLQSQANPVFGLQLWSVVLAHMIFENLRQQRLDHSLKEWTLILHQLDKDYWQLIVCQNQGIVLTRQGPLNKTLSKHSLAQEILTTLRYLNRKDYKEGEPVTVITSGFDTPLVFEDIPELQVITLDQHYDKKTRTLNYFSIRRQLYSYFTRKQPTLAAFERPELRLHRLAFSLPQYFISLGVPSILFLVLGSFFYLGIIIPIKRSMLFFCNSKLVIYYLLTLKKNYRQANYFTLIRRLLRIDLFLF